MKARYLLAFSFLGCGAMWCGANETTLVIEAAPSAQGPWAQVPIGPEALDLKGAIVWEGLPAELKFVRVRVVTPAVADLTCECDACVEVR